MLAHLDLKIGELQNEKSELRNFEDEKRNFEDEITRYRWLIFILAFCKTTFS